MDTTKPDNSLSILDGTIVAVSDSHRDLVSLGKIFSAHPDASLILHAGDYASDMAALDSDIPYRAVVGNSDGMLSFGDLSLIVRLGKCNILLVHGHRQSVKSGLETLAAFAKESGCPVAVFGHTHEALVKNVGGVLLVNPGSCNPWRSRSGEPSYAIIEVSGGDVVSARIVPVP